MKKPSYSYEKEGNLIKLKFNNITKKIELNNNKKLLPEEKEQLEMKYKNKTIHKRKNCNTWYARARINGKQFCISGKTQKECYENLKKFLENNKNSPKIFILSFNAWYNDWLKTYKANNRATTLKGYTSLLKHIPENFKNKEVSKITEIDVLEILNKIPQARQKQKMYIFLKDILGKAYANRKTDINIFAGLKKPEYEAEEEIALTHQEEENFINACTYKNRDFFLLCLYEGLRPGECLALKPEDIDLDKMTLRVDESINPGTTDTSTKNKPSNRITPIFKNAEDILKKYARNEPGQRIFNIGIATVYEELERILKKINIRYITPKNLRHTFITRCQELNIPEYVIQNWVGHKRGSKVTKGVYTHLNSDVNNKYINIINNSETLEK